MTMTTMSVVPYAVHKIITTIQPFYFTQKARVRHLGVAAPAAASSSKFRPDCLPVAAQAAETQEGTGESGAAVSVEGKALIMHILNVHERIGFEWGCPFIQVHSVC